MKKTIAAAGSILILLASCRKVETVKEVHGVMHFQATTSETPVTRTTYSGEVTGGYERIDWTTGDLVRVFTSNTSASGGTSWSGNGGTGVMADYTVNDNTPDGSKSVASLVVKYGQKDLVWGSGVHNIFGLYPSPATSSASANNANGKFTVKNVSYTGGDLSFTGTVPAATITVNPVTGENKAMHYLFSPPMEKAYMWAAQTLDRDSGYIRLPFRPLFNAVELSFTREAILGAAGNIINGAEARNFMLKAVTLTSLDGSAYPVGGTATVSITPNDGNWSDATTQTGFAANTRVYSTTFTLPAYGSAIGDLPSSYNTSDTHNYSKSIYTLRFFIPYNHYGSESQLRVKFDFEHRMNMGNKFSHTLSLKDSGGNWIAMQPGDKLVLSPKNAPALSPEWEYVLKAEHSLYTFATGDGSVKNLSYRVKSYRYNKNNPGQTEPVKWATYINLGGREANTQEWKHISNYTPRNQLKAGWLRFADTANAAGGQSWQGRVIYADNFSTTLESGNPESYFKDAIALNLHPSGINNLSDPDNAIDLSMYTIMGEASQNGRNTANCYVVPAPGWYKIPLVYGNMIKDGSANNPAAEAYHVNHLGNKITGPWLKDVLNSSNFTPVLVWQDNAPVCSKCGHNHGVIDISTAFVDQNGEFLYFHLPQHSIQPGNNVIGVKLGNNLAWSWHIWVTGQELGAKDGRYLNTLIGWIPLSLQGGPSLSTVYPARSEQIKFVQVTDSGETEQEGKEAEVLIYQPGNTNTILFTGREYKFGRGVYYQYGRKDPMFPSLNTGGNNVTQPIYDGDGKLLEGGMQSEMPVTEGIGATVVQTINDPATFLINSTPFASGFWKTDRKSVYDPSPIGFRVIENYDGAFKTSYKNTGLYGEYLTLYNNETFPGAYVGSGGQWFLPAMGTRQGSNSGLLGTPAYKNEFGEGASTVIGAFWAANATALEVVLGTQFQNKGKVSDYWSKGASRADAYPVICIAE